MLTRWRKSRLRRAALKARDQAAAQSPDAFKTLVETFPDALWPAINTVVAGYRAIGSELDPSALMETFALEQARLCLPAVTGPDAPLQFRAWSPGDELVRGAFGVEEARSEASVLTPSLVLVPLVAFDASGGRLGYGAGYYDRTLAALSANGPVTAVGLAYAAQEVRRIPAGAHDVALDAVVTERGVIVF
ncbi:MAG: 5-formyltetrahydrofolate cyclo-ligase [Pseudomonadota bacterium]